MGKAIIEIRNVSKSYKIGASQQYYSLRDVVSNYFSYQVSRLSLILKSGDEIVPKDAFWALKDVSFDVQEGEVIGIIGRNGAGKSTLLKILSRITPPTTGNVIMRGRVASLLEVGTGFHQELTGRENIFLNGAILGMGKKEVQQKFQDIIEFSEMEKFIDTPVKHYSSGMYARLAFAVAAHLESEILIVDEVLAVGDAGFQKKCLNKMGDAAKKGRTVIFVSHSLGMVQALCKRSVLLEDGKVKKIGKTKEVIDFYLGNVSGQSSEGQIWSSPETAPGDNLIRLNSVRVLNQSGKIADTFDIRDRIDIEIKYWNLVGGLQRIPGVVLRNEDGQIILQSLDINNENRKKSPVPVGVIKSVCHIPGNLLSDGKVYVDVVIGTQSSISLFHVDEKNVVSFTVEDHLKKGGVRGDYHGTWPGIVRPMLDWEREIVK